MALVAVHFKQTDLLIARAIARWQRALFLVEGFRYQGSGIRIQEEGISRSDSVLLAITLDYSRFIAINRECLRINRLRTPIPGRDVATLLPLVFVRVLVLDEVADGKALPPPCRVPPHHPRRYQFSGQGFHIAQVIGEQLGLETLRTPLQIPLVIGLRPQADEQQAGQGGALP
ncbi:hypothetical protein D3C85_839080 [compost metagenome]